MRLSTGPSSHKLPATRLSNIGDEILLSPNTPWQITNVRLGTQTFFEAGTLAYTPAFLEVKLYLNDGPLSFWL